MRTKKIFEVTTEETEELKKRVASELKLKGYEVSIAQLLEAKEKGEEKSKNAEGEEKTDDENTV